MLRRRISKNRSRLAEVSSMARRIFTVTGILAGTTSRTRPTISRAVLGSLRQVATPALTQHFLDRASEIDVDAVEARLDQPSGGCSESFRFTAHELRPGWTVSVVHTQKSLRLPSFRHVDDESVQENLADRVGSSQFGR